MPTRRKAQEQDIDPDGAQQSDDFGTFHHADFDGTRHASTAAEAIALQFDGWRPVDEPLSDDEQPAPPAAE